MAETDNTAPYGGYTGPVRFVVKANSPEPHPLSRNLEYSGVVLALDDQGNVLDSYRTGLNSSRAALNDEVNRYQAQVNATITGVPRTITQNYGSESVTVNPGGSMSDPYRLTRVNEDGSLQVRTVDQRGILVAPTITTRPETVPLGTPLGAVDITDLQLAQTAQPADQAFPAQTAQPADQAFPAQAASQPSAAGLPSLLSQSTFRPLGSAPAGARPIIGPRTGTVQPALGFGEELMVSQQNSTLPFTYSPERFR